MRWARAVAMAMLLSRPLHAQTEDADALKKKGDTLLVDRRYADALDAYDRSLALSPNPAIHFNRARALQFLARFPDALTALERFDRESTPELRAKVPGLDDFLAELRSKVATITIANGVDGARLLVGGRDEGRLPLSEPLRVNAGKTSIEILADGWVGRRFDVELPGGQTTSIDGALVRKEQPQPLRIETTRPTPQSTSKSTPITARWWFWVGVGATVVAGIVIASVIAATTEGSAPTGDFSPGQVRF